MCADNAPSVNLTRKVVEMSKPRDSWEPCPHGERFLYPSTDSPSGVACTACDDLDDPRPPDADETDDEDALVEQLLHDEGDTDDYWRD